jgi:hypothetical protein
MLAVSQTPSAGTAEHAGLEPLLPPELDPPELEPLLPLLLPELEPSPPSEPEPPLSLLSPELEPPPPLLPEEADESGESSFLGSVLELLPQLAENPATATRTVRNIALPLLMTAPSMSTRHSTP